MSRFFVGVARLLLAATNSPPIKRGDSGPEIALLQQALVALGFSMPRSTLSDGTMDGIFGSEMFSTVCNFQVRNGLANTKGYGDGIIGALTMAMLDSLIFPFWALPLPTISIGGIEIPMPTTPWSLPPSSFMTIPASAKLQAAYEDYRLNHGKPCQRGITNQCAIRMSVALAKADCGFSFARYRHPGAVHSGNGRCGGTSPHIDNATSLVHYLKELGLYFETYKRKAMTKAEAMEFKDRIAGRSGIVYFEKCFPLGSKRGSHIDFWDGANVMNKVWGYNGTGEPPSSDGFFTGTHGKIWFTRTH